MNTIQGNASAAVPIATPISTVHRLNRLAAIASVAVASILIAAKAGAALSTGSVALLTSLIDSLLDLLASALNLIAIRHAAQPADREHRFGHGKAEPLAGMGQSAFIGGSAVFLMFEAGSRLLRPEPIVNGSLGIAVMVFSIILTLALVLFQKWVVRRTSSVAVGADSLHYTSDLLVNTSVIFALVMATEFGWHQADAIFAIGIGFYILWGASRLFRKSLNLLMDHELPEDERQRIFDLVSSHPGVRSMHDLRTRSSGSQLFIQLHLELDPELNLRQSHAIADEVMQRIEAAFPHADVLIHQDPFGISEKRANFD